MLSVRKLIDLSYVKDISGDDIDFLKELFETFKQQIPEFSGNMHLFLQNKEYKLLAKEAHTAKSSVILFGLDDLAGKLKELQLMAEKEENTHLYHEFLLYFDSTCSQAIIELESLLQD
jgi:HPt (histidine-containing phosphotransfer) domain-containing protein